MEQIAKALLFDLQRVQFNLPGSYPCVQKVPGQ